MQISSIAYAEDALNHLAKLPKKVQILVRGKIEALLGPDKRHRKIQGQKKGTPPTYRIRAGNYRVLYVLQDECILVLDIDHRSRIYRKK